MRPTFVIALFLGTTVLAQTGEAPPAPPAEAAPTPAPQQAPAPPAAPVSPPRQAPAPAASAAPGPAAQQKPVTATEPARAPSAPPRTAPHAPISDEDIVLARAKLAFGSLLLGDPRPLVEQASFPFMLEDRKFNTPDELYEELTRQLRHKRTDMLTLYGIEILSPPDMEKKYGRPPARLSTFPFHNGGKALLAVANLSTHGAVAAYRQEGTDWRMVGYHD